MSSSLAVVFKREKSRSRKIDGGGGIADLCCSPLHVAVAAVPFVVTVVAASVSVATLAQVPRSCSAFNDSMSEAEHREELPAEQAETGSEASWAMADNVSEASVLPSGTGSEASWAIPRSFARPPQEDAASEMSWQQLDGNLSEASLNWAPTATDSELDDSSIPRSVAQYYIGDNSSDNSSTLGSAGGAVNPWRCRACPWPLPSDKAYFCQNCLHVYHAACYRKHLLGPFCILCPMGSPPRIASETSGAPVAPQIRSETSGAPVAPQMPSVTSGTPVAAEAQPPSKFRSSETAIQCPGCDWTWTADDDDKPFSTSSKNPWCSFCSIPLPLPGEQQASSSTSSSASCGSLDPPILAQRQPPAPPVPRSSEVSSGARGVSANLLKASGIEHPQPLKSIVQDMKFIQATKENAICIVVVVCCADRSQWQRLGFVDIVCTREVQELVQEMSLRLSSNSAFIDQDDLMFTSVDGSTMSTKVRWTDYNMTPQAQASAKTAFTVHCWQKEEYWALGLGDAWKEKETEKAAELWAAKRATIEAWRKKSGQQKAGGFRPGLPDVDEEPEPDPAHKDCEQS